MSRILIIEDNPDLAFGLRNNLEIEGYSVEVANDGEMGISLARELSPDLIVLDLMLPKVSGFEVLQRIRSFDSNVLILILSARGEELDKVNGLRLGADDYLTKPFGLMELLARVEALTRRNREQLSHAHSSKPITKFGEISIDHRSRTVTKKGQLVDLAPKEYDLLVTLAENQGLVISRLSLMEKVWGYSSAVVSRTVDTHIGELRKKLEDTPSNPVHIITVRKKGYRLDNTRQGSV